jgi:hypothetical protein
MPNAVRSPDKAPVGDANEIERGATAAAAAPGRSGHPMQPRRESKQTNARGPLSRALTVLIPAECRCPSPTGYRFCFGTRYSLGAPPGMPSDITKRR